MSICFPVLTAVLKKREEPVVPFEEPKPIEFRTLSIDGRVGDLAVQIFPMQPPPIRKKEVSFLDDTLHSLLPDVLRGESLDTAWDLVLSAFKTKGVSYKNEKLSQLYLMLLDNLKLRQGPKNPKTLHRILELQIQEQKEGGGKTSVPVFLKYCKSIKEVFTKQQNGEMRRLAFGLYDPALLS